MNWDQSIKTAARLNSQDIFFTVNSIPERKIPLKLILMIKFSAVWAFALLAFALPGTAFCQSYTISTLAGGGLSMSNIPGTSASLYTPQSIAVDKAGNVFFVDHRRIQRLDAATGLLTVVAGTGAQGYSGDNGPATSAELNNAYGGITVDAAGNLYIADTLNQFVRKVSGGIITTVAGNGQLGFSGDKGPATEAELSNPSGVAVDAAGDLYISDSGNSRVRKVSGGIITTIVGNGSQGAGGGTMVRLLLLRCFSRRTSR